MQIEIRVPAMGESVTEATVAALLKPSGTFVKAEEELIELETDKVNQLLYAPENGTITWSVRPQEHLKIGDLLGTLDTEAIALAEAAPPPKKAAAAEKPVVQPKEPPPAAQRRVAEPAAPLLKTPSTSARISKEEFVSELLAAETAPKEERAKIAQSPEGQRESRQKMSKIRKLISTRLVDVLQQTAMLTTFNEVDMTQVSALRDAYKEAFHKKYAVKLGYMSFFITAVVSALKAFPNLQAYIDGEELVTRHYYDISVAVGTDRGVVTPVIRKCDQLSFAELERTLESFARKAREGGLNPADLQGGGFTITNGGVYGSLLSTPIINPPQCAILGMHKIMKRPVVVDDQVAIRQMMYLALSYDHRIVDGKEAVSFLIHIKNSLEDPARLLIEV